MGDTVSVVICAYTEQRWDQLVAAVDSALAQEPAPVEVLVVVDHCRPLERRARDGLAGPLVRVLGNTRTQGLSGARNTGVAEAWGDVVVFLDDDAAAAPGWLAGHLRHYEDPDVVGVGGHVEPRWQDRAPAWFPPEFGWVVGCSYTGQPTTSGPIRNPIGANMSFRRTVVEAVGGFTEGIGRVGTVPLGCEETELSIRIAAAFPGCRIMHEPDAAVHHHVPAARGQWSYFRRRCWSEGLSKAAVSTLSDPRSALASERSYVLRTLPNGVGRSLGEAGRRRDAASLGRALAICAGLAITSAGYLAGSLQQQPELTMEKTTR